VANAVWEHVGHARKPNWYLDPLVALQERQVHLDLIRRWASRRAPRARVLSTLLFQALRRTLGRQADGLIRTILAVFAALDRLPARRRTACFFAATARKGDRRPTISSSDEIDG